MDAALERAGGLRTTYLAHLRRHPDGLTRECHPDHLTASLLVVDEARDRVLLNLHRRYRDLGAARRPLRAGRRDPGGRCAAGGRRGVRHRRAHACSAPARLSSAGTRCAAGRSGRRTISTSGTSPWRRAGAEPVVSAESLDVRWFDVDALPDGPRAGAARAGRDRPPYLTTALAARDRRRSTRSRTTTRPPGRGNVRLPLANASVIPGASSMRATLVGWPWRVNESRPRPVDDLVDKAWQWSSRLWMTGGQQARSCG